MTRTNRQVLLIGGGVVGLLSFACIGIVLLWMLVPFIIPSPVKSTPSPIAELPSPSPTRASTPTVPPAPTDIPSAGEDDPIERVKRAVVYIDIAGRQLAFDDQRNPFIARHWTGSGFIIDPSGIAVTNNHVVIGKATIQVYVNGEEEPRNAKVLGVSECSDLAVIDIEGEGFPFLEWYAGEITVGMDVYAAGFPLSDPNFTLTKGIISKEHVNGDTSWASVESVIEHDAQIHTGSSGGPLIDAKTGQIVGINYAGSVKGQSYAIGRDAAQALIDQLRTGKDIDSIGLNGKAVTFKLDEEIAARGVLVASVESGSPADKVGLQLGDYVVLIENVALVDSNNTIARYCDVLRSRNPEQDVMKIQVIRPQAEAFEILEGQLNGSILAPVNTVSTAPTSKVVALDLSEPEKQPWRDNYANTRASAQQLLFETFDNKNTKHYWYIRDDEHAAATFEGTGGIYQFTLRQPEVDFYMPLREYTRDQRKVMQSAYIVEVDVALGGTGTHGAGVAFDMQDEKNGSYFFIRSDGAWEVLTLVNGEIAQQFSGVAKTDAIAAGTNQVRVMRLANEISFWIAHTPVAMMAPGPFSGGNVGIAAYAGTEQSGATTVLTDNFRLLQLP